MESTAALTPRSQTEVEAVRILLSFRSLPEPCVMCYVMLISSQLVLELYQPGHPERIAKIQQALQTLQRSAEGWQLANSLLQSTDEKVQFFGALTFTVKLNTDSSVSYLFFLIWIYPERC